MRHFLVSYTVRFNRRNDRSSHVFQGRFKSLLVDEDEYLLPLSRYIHLNPNRTIQFKKADFAQKCGYLKTYRWSSFAGYCYLGKREKHMDDGWLLGTYFGGDTAIGWRQFREYVYRATVGDAENPFENVVHQSIIESQEFVDWAKQMLPRKGQRKVPSLKKMQHDIPVERILAEVAKAANAKAGDLNLRDRRTKFKDLRRMTMELSYRYSNN
jgi:hypothetical protein